VVGVRDDLRFESLNAFGKFLTTVVQPGDRLTACFAMASSASTSSMSSGSTRMPFSTFRPNSVARPRMAFASIDCCLTNRDRAACWGHDALLLDALGCYELHIGSRGGFADRRGICRLILRFRSSEMV
jgi:hypothetical protein